VTNTLDRAGLPRIVGPDPSSPSGNLFAGSRRMAHRDWYPEEHRMRRRGYGEERGRQWEDEGYERDEPRRGSMYGYGQQYGYPYGQEYGQPYGWREREMGPYGYEQGMTGRYDDERQYRGRRYEQRGYGHEGRGYEGREGRGEWGGYEGREGRGWGGRGYRVSDDRVFFYRES
jgi:hypothetical protein